MGKESHNTYREITASAEFAKNRIVPALERIAEQEAGGKSNRSNRAATYRAYVVGHDGHFKAFEIINADDDKSAIESALKYVDGHDVELWDLDRKVAVLSHIK